ncbi:MAG: hypothetical protein ABJA98_32055 [Acidobacteriota bacterium]
MNLDSSQKFVILGFLLAVLVLIMLAGYIARKKQYTWLGVFGIVVLMSAMPALVAFLILAPDNLVSRVFGPTVTKPATAVGKHTPEQVASARSVMASVRQTATVEEDGTALHVTFNTVDRAALYQRAEMIVIADQVLHAPRYVHFYGPTHEEVATFSPSFGLKLRD